MTKEITKTAAVAAGIMLGENWFDAIEDGVRERARGFAGTMLKVKVEVEVEVELDGALPRRRSGRRSKSKSWSISESKNPGNFSATCSISLL